MVGGTEKDKPEKAIADKPKEEAGELDELKHNLRVSFSRMKEDIQANKQQAEGTKAYVEGMKEQIENLVKTNRLLLEQMGLLKDEIRALKERPKGLKTELMRSLARNQKTLIKQRILEMVGQGRFSIPELKERIVDDRNYCSKASFYRYIEELKSGKRIDFLSVEGREVVVAVGGEGRGTSSETAPELKKREDFV